MSLPPALLARLKRRKIIQEVVKDVPNKQEGEEESRKLTDRNELSVQEDETPLKHEDEMKEEILAEDYSEESSNEEDVNAGRLNEIDGHNDTTTTNTPYELNEQNSHETNLAILASEGESVIGCPNKYNVYHTCERYCLDNYSNPENREPSLEQRKLLASLLKTFPLPDDWVVVFEPGVNTFYFWNIITNLVTWYPPTMNVFPSLAANQIRRLMHNDMDGAQIVMPE